MQQYRPLHPPPGYVLVPRHYPYGFHRPPMRSAGIFGIGESACITVSNRTDRDVHVLFTRSKTKDGTLVSEQTPAGKQGQGLPIGKQSNGYVATIEFTRPAHKFLSGDRELMVLFYDADNHIEKVMRKSISGSDNHFDIYDDRILSVKAPNQECKSVPAVAAK